MQKQVFSQKHGGKVTSLVILLIFGFSFTSIPLWFVPSNHLVLDLENNQVDKILDVSIFDRPNGFIGAGDIPWPIIVIDDDGDFESQGWLGDGSSSNPYRIENLSINAASDTNRIQIWNTRAHFLIKNCSLTGSTGGEYAIQLLNVTNAVITDNDIFGNDKSVDIINSTDVICMNNTCSQAAIGISVRSNSAPTYNVQILNNTLTGGTDGIRGYNNHELTIADNHLSGITDAGMYFYNSESVSITNNTLAMPGHWGIYIDDDISDSVVSFNTIIGCTDGIHLDGTSLLVVKNNSISTCTDGIDFEGADYNIVENNTISGCTNGALLDVHSNGNDIIWNFFEGNSDQVEDDGASNNIRNNYYDDYVGSDANSDGIGDTPYTLVGISSNEDPYPLFSKNVARLGLQWNPIPGHQIYELGESFRYDLNTTSTVEVVWSMTWGSFWTVDSNGIITNATNDAGFASREVHVIATNIHARSIDAYFNITSQDTIVPTWEEQPESEYFWNQGQTFSVNFAVIDAEIALGYIGTWWINNTLNFELNDDLSGGCAITGNDSTVVFGSYGLEVKYTDQAGHSVSAAFTVIYRDYTDPTFEEGPDPYTFTEGAVDVITLTWVFSDLNPYSYELKLDGDVIQFSLWSESPGTVIEIVNVSILTVGHHIYLMTIIDIAGNTDTHETEIIIEVGEPTTTTEPPPEPIPLETIIIAASVVGIVLVVIIILALKKRG